MSITMQGNWTVRVQSKSAAFDQRFVVTGSTNGVDGAYAGDTSTPPVFVTGPQWSINVQNRAPGGPWRESRQRMTAPSTSGGVVRFQIRTDDAGGDEDFNDLVLTCSMPVASSEFIVYGRAKTYRGRCRFNPCYRFGYVIDRPATLAELLGVAEVRRVVEKLYPEKVRDLRRPGPRPDPPPYFTPLVIPTTARADALGVEFQSSSPRSEQGLADSHARSHAGHGHEGGPVDADRMEAAAVEKLGGTTRNVTFNAAPLEGGRHLVSQAELLGLAKQFDRFVAYCVTEPAPGLLLRLQEYDRTEAEKLGGPYTGEGARENVGLAATDEAGNYLFRFSRMPEDFADEFSDVAPGETASSQIRPDVIVQALGAGLEVDYESAPYHNIPNLRRIDLCIPHDRVRPNRECSGDRVIQRVGDIIVLHSSLGGSPNTLDSQGRITCRNANAPQVNCAAWRGALRVYACFGRPEVVRYTVQHKRPWQPDSDYQFVSEAHTLNHIPDFSPTYTGTPVGSALHSVNVRGGAAQTVPTYANHEGDGNWIENELKIILHTGNYRPAAEPGPVRFRVEGYDAAGNLVAETVDEITLYLDNKPAAGDIVSISMGGVPQTECGLFEMTDHAAPLTVRYRATDPEGFLQSWGLSVLKGNNHPFAVTATAGSVALSKSHPADAPSACTFTGTSDEPTADADGYVETTLVPTGGGNWLSGGEQFCAFGFTLTAHDRVTDGRTAHPQAVSWTDLVGISYV